MGSQKQIGITIKAIDKASASINAISEKFDGLGKSVQKSAKTLGTLAVFGAIKKMTAPINNAIKSAMSMSDSIASIAARSDIAADTLKTVAENVSAANSVASKVGYSTQQILGHVNALAQAGVVATGMTADEMTEIAMVAANIEKVYGDNASTIAGYADMLGDIFGATGRDLNNMMASTYLAARKAGGTASEFFDVLRNEGAFMAQGLGLNFEQIRDGLTGLATSTSFNSKKVGSTISAAIMGLQKPTQEGIAVLNKFGIARKDIFDEAGQLVQAEGENPLVTFLKKFKGADIKELSAVFGSERARAMSAMIAQVEKVRELSGTDFGDATADLEKRAQSANGLFGELARTLTIIKNKMVEIFEPIATKLGGVLKSFNDWLAGNNVAQWVTAVGISFASLVSTVVIAFQKFKIFVNTLREVSPTIDKIFDRIGSLITKTFSRVPKLANTIAPKVSSIFRGIVSGIVSAFRNFWGFVVKAFSSMLKFATSIPAKLKSVWGFAAKAFGFVRRLASPLLRVASIVSKFFPALLRVFGIVVRFVGPVGLAISAIVTWVNVFQMLWGRFGDFLEGLIYLVKHPIDSIQTLFFGFVDDIKAKIQSLVGYLPDFIKKRIGLSFAVDGSAGAPTAADIKASMQKANAARVGGDVNVNFTNAPAGMRVTTEPRPGTTLPTNVGYNLLSPAWGMGG